MKKILFLLLFLLVTNNESKSQNLLNYSESSIKSFMSDRKIYFGGKKYAKDGVPFLEYSYSTISAGKDGLIAAAYYLDDYGICNTAVLFYTDMKFLDAIVSNFKSDIALIKVPDKFGWIEKDRAYEIQIFVESNNTFQIAYRKRKKLD